MYICTEPIETEAVMSTMFCLPPGCVDGSLKKVSEENAIHVNLVNQIRC